MKHKLRVTDKIFSNFFVSFITLCISSCIPASGSRNLGYQIVSSKEHTSKDEPIFSPSIGRIFLSDRTCIAFRSGPSQITTLTNCISDTNEHTKFQNGQSTGKLIFFKNGNGKIEKLNNIPNRLENEVYTQLEASTQSEWLEIGKPELGYGQHVTRTINSHALEISDSCKITPHHEYGIFSYECKAQMGDLGAPLIQNGKIIGIHLGFSAKFGKNIAYDFSHQPKLNLKILDLTIELWNTTEKNQSEHFDQKNWLKPRKSEKNSKFVRLSMQDANCSMIISSRIQGSRLCTSCLAGATDTVDSISRGCSSACATNSELLSTAIMACAR